MAPGLDDALAVALRTTALPLAQARTLPAACYTDPAIHALERRALFGRQWLALARDGDVPEPGSFVTRELVGESALIVRGADRVLRGFFNVCRHRGSRLVEEACGRLRGALACPYHAWTYELDGRLRQAPRMDIGARADSLGLVRLPLEVAAGFVFVSLDPAAPSFREALPDLPDVSHLGLAQLVRARCLEYRVEANWKLVCENYSECYHCPRAHPQLDRLCELSSGGFESGVCFNGGPMQLRPGFDTLSMSGRSRWPRLAAAAADDPTRLVHYYLVYPNLMLGIHPDYLAVHTVWPLGPSSSRVLCEIFVPPRARALPGFDPADVVGFWDLTNRQDWALCERVQRGVASLGYRPGPFAPSERCVHAFDRWYAEWLLGTGALA